MAPPTPPPSRSQIARIVTAIAKGHTPGFGSAQSDTFQVEDNVDASHGLRLPYVVPRNIQRLISARLTIALYAYRTYDAPAAGALHVHFWSSPGSGASGGGSVAVTAGGALVNTGTSPFGKQTSTELWNPAPAAGPSQDTATEGENLTGHTHAQVLGVTEGATATGVAITFDGVDETAALGGPFNANQIEMDITKYVSVALSAIHTILLTPSGLGRIHAILRLNYFVDASIPA